MDYARLLFAAEVRKLAKERASIEIGNMSPDEVNADVQGRALVIFHEVIDELENYAIAIEEYRSSKTK
ncbi:hypothetical protein [Telluria aromaticivorans]|uniref:Uncharacterized protein n=1 Tax=Telluria aromaticivorans TaxID=2725995 RepID=A0A7Y2K0E1_9BURK|nr:hypothetical protein [Telluria aromaticivorans]NNG24352.1 hypothetical protein [Telluria aromaticivorans]